MPRQFMPIRSPATSRCTPLSLPICQQYQDKLPPGQIEMLKRLPSYKMVVYPSHRTAALPQREYDHIKVEAGKAALAEGGTGIVNVKNSTVPFPMPKSGVEVIWNYLARYRGEGFIRNSNIFPVQTNGTFTPVSRIEYLGSAAFVKNAEPESPVLLPAWRYCAVQSGRHCVTVA